MAPRPPSDPIFFESPAELRDWLDANHETASELWIGQFRKAAGKPTVSWPEVVDEVLCVGWIDGVRYSIDAERFTQRLTPRRKGSNWSAINIAKIEKLIAEGRMRPAGLAAFEGRSDARSAIYSYERRDEAAFDADQEKAFRANEQAWAWFEGRPPSYRRTATHWVVSAKKPETRASRLERLIEDSAAGQPIGPLRQRRGP